jgi:Zn-dependent protease with chaperone function
MNEVSGSYAGLVQAALVASLVFAAPVSLLCAVSYPTLRRVLAAWAPSARSAAVLALSLLPFMAAVAGLLATFSPSLLSWLGVIADHCHLHPDHPHLCLSHPPLLHGSTLVYAALLAGAGLCLLAAGSWTVRWIKTRRTVAQLVKLSVHHAVHGVHIVPTEAPIAFAAGLRAPRLFLSRLLLTQLTPGQLDAVIAHERAHAARFDALRQTVAAALSRLHLPATRRLLLSDLALAAEQSCDEAAGAATGDRLLVAQAIITVERLFASQAVRAPALFSAAHFTGSHVGERVQAMLDAPRAAVPVSRVVWPVLGASLLAFAVAAQPLHHATETLLGFLFH